MAKTITKCQYCKSIDFETVADNTRPKEMFKTVCKDCGASGPLMFSRKAAMARWTDNCIKEDFQKKLQMQFMPEFLESFELKMKGFAGEIAEMRKNVPGFVKSKTGGEIVVGAIAGKDLTVKEVLALYADPDNWKMDHFTGKCRWVWDGPVICAYETAMRLLAKKGASGETTE